MKVLISDTLGESGIRMFQAEEGIEVDVKTGLPPEELKKIIGDYDALVIRSATKVTADLLEAASNLKVVGRAGIGLDNVDLPTATKRGVVVMNTPGGNVVTTAEHAIAMMMSATRNIARGTATMKAGKWEKKKLQGREIMDKTLGVIGFGKIGSVVADRARGLKMRVLVYDPVVHPDIIEKQRFECVSLKTLYQKSDYITIHVPKNQNTVGMINADAFARMKDGVIIINCARGGIIDESALYDALTSGKAAHAALDVFETEPPPADHPLLKLDNVTLTPHLGASTLEAQTNVAEAVALQIIQYLKHGNIVNAVNVPAVSGELLKKLEPYLMLADRLGSMQGQFAEGQLKEIQIEYRGDFEDMEMTPVTTAFVKGVMDYLVKEGVNAINAPLLAKEMGVRISESRSTDTAEFLNLIGTKVVTTQCECVISGTVFSRTDARIVRINDFRIEIIPQGYLALIHNQDEPGVIGSIGRTLGDHSLNISRMQVGREVGKGNNVVLIRTDTPIGDEALKDLLALPKIKSVKLLEL